MIKNKCLGASIPVFLGIVCLIIYKATTRIELNGTLREPFYLLPFRVFLLY
ncbi:TPA: DUF3955 domain-containing protein [Bacillus toyonensis]|nr:DUF3955 domain-containing protein [Bacillus toyonensis]